MTLSEMRAELLKQMGNVTDNIADATRLNLWLNWAYDDMATSYEFPQLLRVVTFSLDGSTTSVRFVNLPTDCYAVYSVKDTTNNKKLTKTSYKKLDDLNQSASTTATYPTHYDRVGDMIEIYPTLTTTMNGQLRYCRRFSLLSNDTDEPVFSRTFHEALVVKARAKGLRATFEYDKAKESDNDFVSIMRSRMYEFDIEDQDKDFALEVYAEHYQTERS